MGWDMNTTVRMAPVLSGRSRTQTAFTPAVCALSPRLSHEVPPSLVRKTASFVAVTMTAGLVGCSSMSLSSCISRTNCFEPLSGTLITLTGSPSDIGVNVFRSLLVWRPSRLRMIQREPSLRILRTSRAGHIRRELVPVIR